ncbi:hypothetical protein [Maribellus mangrovi]|uniref:hypothetical protein n=1 Tax=Maribellus mangrovi TaxID=3133146 RepID=UPI0030EC1D90
MKGYLLALSVLVALIGCSEVSENNCLIDDLELDNVECNSDSTFMIHLHLQNQNSDLGHVVVYDASNKQIGALSSEFQALEVDFGSFLEGDTTTISVCADDNPNCCKEFKLKIPHCMPECIISELTVDPGECIGNNKYNLHLNFNYENPGNDFFNVFGREDKLIGTYKLADLPVVIENFEGSGNDYDFIKVCINDKPDCCIVSEFQAPNCAEECTISELTVDPGECTGNNKYNLHLNFSYENPGNDFFNVFGREDKLIGTYKLADLPVVIENFEGSGNDYDFIKVCINDKPDCCIVSEFQAPNCAEECTISELTVDPGECTGNNKYNLHLNFNYENPGNDFFNVFGREDKLIGTYKLADLPVVIENFEGSGNDYDFIKVCINDKPDCCIVSEFQAPNCAEECTISELTVDPGECVNDSTYSVTINFSYSNPNNKLFEVFGRNNKYYGYYNLTDLPVTITEFRKSGSDHDLVKVCINDSENCCKLKEIASPNCSD